MRLAAHRRSTLGNHLDWLPLVRESVGVSSGGSMEVVRIGRGDPIVLLPGLAGGWKLLLPLAQQLASQHSVVLVGYAGDHPITPRLRSRDVAEEARDVADLLDRLGLERPMVFGVSYGGAVALELAANQPGLPGSLVLYGVESSLCEARVAGLARRVLERFPLPTNSQFVNQFFNLLHGTRPEPGPLAEFVVQRCWETDQAVMAGRLRALEAYDVSARLDRIDVPALVLAGDLDVVVRPERQRQLARALPAGRFRLIPNAGHIGFLSERAAVARHIYTFTRSRVAVA